MVASVGTWLKFKAPCNEGHTTIVEKYIIQSEYYATRIMVLENSSQPPFYIWHLSSKITLLRLLAPTFFISMYGWLNCLGPCAETLLKSLFVAVDGFVFLE